MKVTKSKLVIFSVAIALVSVFFFAYAVQSVYPAPRYEDYCEDFYERPEYIPSNSVDCLAEGGKWETNIYPESEIKGWCQLDYGCNKDYDAVRKPYERNVFFISLTIGVIVFVVAFFLGIEAVSSGLMGGAVLTIFYGTIRYWGNLSDVWRTVFLGLVLVGLIWLGYRKLNEV